MEASLEASKVFGPYALGFLCPRVSGKYVTDMYKETKWKQFLNLNKRSLSVAEYEKEFSHLRKYAPELVLIEAFRCRQFEYGLNESIKRYLAPVTSLQHVNFYQLVQAAMKVERFEESSKERFQKKKFSIGASSFSGKRARESQAESVYNSATRGRRQGPNVAPSSGRGASAGQGENSKCSHCHRWHSRCCRRVTGGCFRCGSTNLFLANCPRESGDSRNPQGIGHGGSMVPPTTHDRGVSRQQRGQGSLVLETVDRPISIAPTRAYAMKAREDQDTPEVIAGIFSLYDIEMHALIDPGSTHSYICTEHVFDRMPPVEKLPYDMHVTNPLGIALMLTEYIRIAR